MPSRPSAAAEPRRSPPEVPLARRVAPALLGALAGLVLSLALLFVVRQQTPAPLPAPTATAESLCIDLRQQNYTHLYSLLATSARTGTEAQFIASQRQLDVLAGQTTACAYTVQAVSGSEANLSLTVTRGGAAPAAGAVRLVWEQGTWRIAAYDTSLV